MTNYGYGTVFDKEAGIFYRQPIALQLIYVSVSVSVMRHFLCRCLSDVQRLSSRIKKLQESELTLDDMESEDSNFVLEEKCVVGDNACILHHCVC